MDINIIINKDLYLKTLSEITDEYFEMINNCENTKYLYAGRQKHSKESLEKYLVESNKDFPNCVIGIYKNSKHVGNLRLSNFNKVDDLIEIGWLIRKQNWGQGLGFLTGKALCEHVFNELNIRKIQLGVVRSNENAVKLYHKLGFKTEGILRESFYVDKKFYDIIKMGMFKHELVK